MTTKIQLTLTIVKRIGDRLLSLGREDVVKVVFLKFIMNKTTTLLRHLNVVYNMVVIIQKMSMVKISLIFFVIILLVLNDIELYYLPVISVSRGPTVKPGASNDPKIGR